MITKEKREELKTKLETVSVTARNKKIFKYRYGLDDGIYREVSEVGKKFKLTAESIRLICKKINALIEG